MKRVLTVGLVATAAAATLIAFAPPAQAGENVGTSCADCPNFSGAFSIENTTGAVMRYDDRWGDAANGHDLDIKVT